MPPRSEPRTIPELVADLYERLRRTQDLLDRSERRQEATNTEAAEQLAALEEQINGLAGGAQSTAAAASAAATDIRIVGVGDAVFGGPPPPPGDVSWRKWVGTFAGVTGAAGELVMPIPPGVFVNGIATVLHSEGDVTTLPHHVQQRLSGISLTQIEFLVRDFDGTTTVGVSIRVNAEVTGW